MKKIQGLKNRRGGIFKHDMSFIRSVILHYETSDLSTAQIGQIYGIRANQVVQWRKRFSSELGEQRPLPTMSPKQQNELDSLKKQNEELLKRLELANLKITALEIMIDIAEQDYKLDIRKKPGTKQSDV